MVRWSASLCYWKMDFLTNRPQHVRSGHHSQHRRTTGLRSESVALLPLHQAWTWTQIHHHFFSGSTRSGPADWGTSFSPELSPSLSLPNKPESTVISFQKWKNKWKEAELPSLDIWITTEVITSYPANMVVIVVYHQVQHFVAYSCRNQQIFAKIWAC